MCMCFDNKKRKKKSAKPKRFLLFFLSPNPNVFFPTVSPFSLLNVTDVLSPSLSSLLFPFFITEENPSLADDFCGILRCLQRSCGRFQRHQVVASDFPACGNSCGHVISSFEVPLWQLVDYSVDDLPVGDLEEFSDDFSKVSSMKLSKVILTISLDSFWLLKYEMSFGLLIVGFVIHG
jgi:hypothetical protein